MRKKLFLFLCFVLLYCSLVWADSRSVFLQWTDHQSGVAGYNIYRSQITHADYRKVNSYPVPVPEYTDYDVPAGTWFYVVTAVGDNGKESGYSNQATALVP